MSATRRAAAVLLGGVFACVLLEVLARVTGLGPPPPTPTGYVADPVLPYRLRPDAAGVAELARDGARIPFQHNGRGFQDRDRRPGPLPGTWRIVALGDSFTYGAGAPPQEGWPAQLERMLAARPSCDVPVEVINLGVPRYFPAAERLLLREEGLRYAPDVVLVAVTPNDVIDTYLGLDAVTVNSSGYLVPRAAQALGPFAVALLLHSQLARAAMHALYTPHATRGAPASPDALYVRDGFYEPDWRAMEADLAALVADARRHGAVVVVLGVPQSGITDPQVDAFDHRLAQWSTDAGVGYVSVLAALRAADAHEPMYWRYDGHCRPAGYRVIAERLAAELAHAGLAPCEPPPPLTRNGER